MRLRTHGRIGWTVGVLVAFGACAGRYAQSEVIPDRADLACEHDEDCQVANSDIRGCCPYKTSIVQPFAISKRALQRIRTECSEVLCPMMLLMAPGAGEPKDFVAVCARRSCRLRPAPPAPPDCVDDGVPSLCAPN